MQATNVEISRTTKSVYAEFELASQVAISINASWFDDDRRGCEFCAQLNVCDRNDMDIKAGDGTARYISRALEILKVKFIASEVHAIEKFLAEFKVQTQPS